MDSSARPVNGLGRSSSLSSSSDDNDRNQRIGTEQLDLSSQSFPLTEENLQALLSAIGQIPVQSPSSRLPHNDNDYDTYSESVSTSDIRRGRLALNGIRTRDVSEARTIDSTPQGSVVNMAARRMAAHIGGLTGRSRPVQGTRHKRRLENERMLNNPHAVIPEPPDFLPGPTYMRRRDADFKVFMATLQAKVPEFRAFEGIDEQDHQRSSTESIRPSLPRSLKDRVKRGHLTQPFVQSLEKDIREFVAYAHEHGPTGDAAASMIAERDIPVPEDTEKAESFMRWVIYQIASYYQVSCYTKLLDSKKVPCIVIDLERVVPENPPAPIWAMI
ncbi:hypothetical protein V1511DRAFT_476195 [Dipodascopsis uninucleata]